MELTSDFMVSALKTPSHMLEAAVALYESILRSRGHGYVSRRRREHEAQARTRAASRSCDVHGPADHSDQAPAQEVDTSSPC